MDRFEELVAWYRGEFDRRTSALNSGQGRIDWLDAGSRVSFSEVSAKAEELGIKANPVDLRTRFAQMINRNTKNR
jgi:hypothetical protein